ncbi:PspC domain-containing protein [Emticicia sp. CRIBPO]|jgi:phage shock protein C|uniref:PspC domain-containing protein n=1 Tax=Emticicia sp. CRIBPO TaxID=2683258 RepID=UPI00141302AB|nr:PspC domain-containing protein [Emticicia sp. CRIBPO]NBA87614.1 PspC domain-containing protein [Emticicia sp. CRIBPO]
MKKKLYRIKNKDTFLGGVSLGLGKYFEIDPTIVRILFVVLFFTPFPSFIGYVILWMVLPEKYDYEIYQEEPELIYETKQFKTENKMSNQSKNGNMVGGLILIILGAIFSFKTFFDINLFSYIGKLWPLILVGLGVWLIVKEKDDDHTGFGGNSNFGGGAGTDPGQSTGF